MLTFSRQPNRRRVPWLVQTELAAVRQPDRRHDAPSLLLDWPCKAEPTFRQLRDSRIEVVAHEIQFVPTVTVIAWMDRDFGRGHRKDRPSSARLHRWPIEEVAQYGTHAVRLGRVNQRMNAGDQSGPNASR